MRLLGASGAERLVYHATVKGRSSGNPTAFLNAITNHVNDAMTVSPPKLRNDLTISEQRLAGDVVSIIKDPLTGNFFRLGEAERFIADQLDGATAVEVVRQRAEAKFATTLPQETLNQFVKMLEKGGLLESGAGREKALRRQTRRIQGNLLYQRVRMCDPDRLFNWLIGRIGFFFTPYFMLGVNASDKALAVFMRSSFNTRVTPAAPASTV